MARCGRVCLIAGAGRGVGRHYALMLAAHGAHVVVNDAGPRPLGRDGQPDRTGAIAPGALTRTTEDLPIPGDVKASLDHRWVPVCVWLASTLSTDVTERIIDVSGSTFAVAERWQRARTGTPVGEPAEVDAAIRELLARVRPHTKFAGQQEAVELIGPPGTGIRADRAPARR